MPPRRAERFRAFVDGVFDGGAGWTDELTCLTEDGRRIPTEISASRVVLDGRDCLLAMVRDVSGRERRERERRESERKFWTLAENLEEIVWMSSADPSDFLYVNPAYEDVWGRDREELYAGDGLAFLDAVHPDDRERVREAYTDLPERGYEEEFRVQQPDGSVRWILGQAVPLRDEDGTVHRIVGIGEDVTERKERERELERQREHLDALNKLNRVGREITDAAIDQSTREEIERTVCEAFAESDFYEFAWMAEVDPVTKTIDKRVEAGVDGYIENVALSTDSGDATGRGPTGRAIRSQEVVPVRNVFEDPAFEPWRDVARQYGYRASAAVPVVYEGTMYGVVGVYTTRADAFSDDECRMLAQLGETVGHAIAATERRRALLSEEVVKLDFRIADAFDTFDVDASPGCRIAIDETIPLQDDDYLVYGHASAGDLDVVRALTDTVSSWESMAPLGDETDGDEPTRFKLRLSDPPVLGAVTSRGGRVEEAVFEDGDYRMSIHLPPGVDTRDVINTVQSAYPASEMVTRRRSQRPDVDASPSDVLCGADLTERQRSTLEAAFFGGFFEWPRESAGEDVADAMDVSPPTFHQHLRTAQRKVFESILSDAGGVD
ncbi:bacterio-opsin activator domain-containing protein [Halospeciosus flavus]|uniref:bacterio-opsin activator domain-containing protein n=1 Tax=Halospeciosus flavus TaxID=3032283 RepID=UPI00360D346C